MALKPTNQLPQAPPQQQQHTPFPFPSRSKPHPPTKAGGERVVHTAKGGKQGTTASSGAIISGGASEQQEAAAAAAVVVVDAAAEEEERLLRREAAWDSHEPGGAGGLGVGGGSQQAIASTEEGFGWGPSGAGSGGGSKRASGGGRRGVWGRMKDRWMDMDRRGSYAGFGQSASSGPSISNRQILMGFVALGLIFSLPSLSSTYGANEKGGRGGAGGGGKGGGLKAYDPSRTEWRFKIIADLDQQSKDNDAKKPLFHSYLIEGVLQRDPKSDSKYTVQWGKEHTLSSAHNEAGRGMELSELIHYNGKLYTVDDRTGIVFEVADKDPAAAAKKDDKSSNKKLKGASKETAVEEEMGEPVVVPRWIVMEGDGLTDKGMKLEWATVKDGRLVLGSFGKEYTAPDGTVINTNNLWVNYVDEEGHIEHVDWQEQYDKIRKALGADSPGYVIHEAACWSEIRREWVFLPRRVSSLPYDEELDEKMGSNKIVIANEDFSKLEVREVGKITPERGFSSFKFVPGSQDQLILALKSVEEAATGKQGTYITLFNLKGDVLLDETPVPGAYKFEGLEFTYGP